MRYSIPVCLTAALLLASCAPPSERNVLEDYELVRSTEFLDLPAAAAAPAQAADPAQFERGAYLVTLLGCGSCHTDGALVGQPRADRVLAGSQTGIAYSNPLKEPNPGVVYPANLTPDMETGLGGWTEAQIIDVVRRGIDPSGRRHLSVMPWPAYGHLADEDARAIAVYLKGLSPVRHAVPDNVSPGQRATAPFVHFGIYQSRQ